MTDTFDLERFVTAQEPVFDTVLSELRAGRKRSHWMWFIFPQLRGLGRSSMAEYYGISSLAKACSNRLMASAKLSRDSGLTNESERSVIRPSVAPSIEHAPKRIVLFTRCERKQRCA